ncbi:MAG: ABC transporter ATP-binding protein [Solirubrobacterales bacterium]
MLKVRDLTVRFGPILALDKISFDVEEGEFVSLVGLNGAGKSTALAAITGLVRPVSGSVTFDGQSLAGRSPEDIVRMGVALVPEGRHIFRSLTVEENLHVALTSRADKQRAKDDVQQVRARFPALEHLWETPAGRLSGGEQQQLAIGRALVCRPRILLLDEPSLGLAPKIVDVVFALLKELHEEGVAVLLVEQNAVRAVQVADRGHVLRRGRIVVSATGKDLSERHDLAELYLGL